MSGADWTDWVRVDSLLFVSDQDLFRLGSSVGVRDGCSNLVNSIVALRTPISIDAATESVFARRPRSGGKIAMCDVNKKVPYAVVHYLLALPRRR